jgi:hypothetical protein
MIKQQAEIIGVKFVGQECFFLLHIDINTGERYMQGMAVQQAHQQ